MSSWYTIQRLSALTRLITAVGVSDIGKERWYEEPDGRWDIDTDLADQILNAPTILESEEE